MGPKALVAASCFMAVLWTAGSAHSAQAAPNAAATATPLPHVAAPTPTPATIKNRYFSEGVSGGALYEIPHKVHSTPRWYALTANEAKALQTAYAAQTSGGISSARLAAATVHIIEQRATVQLKFTWADGSISTVNVEKRTHEVQLSPATRSREATPASEMPAELAILGEDARAIATVLTGLSSGSVRLPFPKVDFDSNRFTVQEHSAFSSPTGKPGYYVVYIPAATNATCPKYTVYRVDPTTWQVFEQPHIC